jgi:homoserine trans-succinylase
MSDYKYKVSWVEFFRDKQGEWDSEVMEEYFQAKDEAEICAAKMYAKDKISFVEIQAFEEENN